MCRSQETHGEATVAMGVEGYEKAGEGVRRDAISSYNLKDKPVGLADVLHVGCTHIREESRITEVLA